ncbi:hypothetical protein BKN38_03955 [Helicobacter sp. CLO-3]|uniref:SH3 domain-containing protein n=1 Tax=unclassified Helicobacter TaxID=2593540 RepID=UPI000804DD14|nr:MULTISPECIES: SH3 domain-containing protein [unclassified Helicobacter]OBV29847.1 hypothetical protein BA723_03895 [Helicobacter sp. CLO-3]OHU84073.1 hypothetical protein BKN38_03955 [Helicobacter sp. CLO-3]
MKLFIKAYTLPILILLIGLAIYYFVFAESVKRRDMGHGQTLAEAPKEAGGAESSGESGAESTPDKNAPTRLAGNDITSALPDASAQTPQTIDASASPAPNSAESNAAQTPPNAQDSSQDSDKTSATQSATQNTTPSTPNTTGDTKKEAIYYVTATSVNVRAEPSTTARIVRKLTLGQSAVVTHIQDDWAKLDSGGWVSLALLSAIEPKQKLYTVIPNTLNIREEPLPNARVIGALYKDQRVQVEQVQDDWAKLDSGGWVSRRLLKELK